MVSKNTIGTKQWSFLQQQIQYAAKHSVFYKQELDRTELDVDLISGDYNQFTKIPITSKEQLQQYHEQFLAVPQDTIIDHVTTSGTLGKPVSVFLNDHDLERLAENESRSFKLAGIASKDKVLITTTLDRRFMAGMAYFLGLRKLGAGAIRTGGGLPGLQWDSILRFKPEYMIAVPSFLLKLIEYAKQNKIDYKNSSIRTVICIGEPIRNANYQLNSLGKKITSQWNLQLYSTYASTEMATAFTECSEHRGNHVPEDLIYTEVLDLKGNHVPEGEIGELVVTPLGVQTMPLLRYATGDMLTYTDTPCSCGRPGRRLGPVQGRKQQKIKLKGTSLYPQHIMEILNILDHLDMYVVQAFKDELGGDRIKIIIPDNYSDLSTMQEYLKSSLHVLPQIELVAIEELEKIRMPKHSRKPIIFQDLR